MSTQSPGWVPTRPFGERAVRATRPAVIARRRCYASSGAARSNVSKHNARLIVEKAAANVQPMYSRLLARSHVREVSWMHCNQEQEHTMTFDLRNHNQPRRILLVAGDAAEANSLTRTVQARARGAAQV